MLCAIRFPMLVFWMVHKYFQPNEIFVLLRQHFIFQSFQAVSFGARARIPLCSVRFEMLCAFLSRGSLRRLHTAVQINPGPQKACIVNDTAWRV